MQDILDKHEKIVFLFSGGKDSMACLYLLKDYWHKINVIWVNTGAAFPEIIKMMDSLKILIPNFTEIKSNQPSYVEYFGLPADVVPVNRTLTGTGITANDKQKINIYLDCCGANIWFPAYNAAKEYGATLIIKGQKNSDGHKSSVRSLDVIEGITHYMPIQDWSDDDVFKYLKEQDFVCPDFYNLHDTSLDCWDCTAYCSHHIDKLEYMKGRHDEKRNVLLNKLVAVHDAIIEEMSPMVQMLGGLNA